MNEQLFLEYFKYMNDQTLVELSLELFELLEDKTAPKFQQLYKQFSLSSIYFGFIRN